MSAGDQWLTAPVPHEAVGYLARATVATEGRTWESLSPVEKHLYLKAARRILDEKRT